MNVLKPYFDRSQTASTEVKVLVALNAPTTETVEGVAVSEIAQSRLPNSEIVADLEFHLSYLNLSERSNVIQLIY